ncbi:hypothetical protein [Ralstonia pseudosolanacearum]
MMSRKLLWGKSIPVGMNFHKGKNLGEDSYQEIDNQYASNADSCTSKLWRSDSHLNPALPRLDNVIHFFAIPANTPAHQAGEARISGIAKGKSKQPEHFLV